MGKDASFLYMQVPNKLSQLSPGTNRKDGQIQPYFGVVGGGLPSDVSVRIPIGSMFFARPQQDTVMTLTPMDNPVNGSYSNEVRLHRLDPRAVTYKTVGTQTRFGAINQNNYLLFGYHSRAAAGTSSYVLRLVLAQVTKNNFQRLQVQPRVLDLPSGAAVNGAYSISQITAIDDYFLVSQLQEGIYKVKQDGSVRKVDNTNQISSFYKWQGKVYAQALNRLLVSSDDGETWTAFTGSPSFLIFSDFRVLGDSLIGHTTNNNQLYTLRWNGGSGRVRELKNDGLEQTEITGLEQLGDTVYVGTTNGLFKRPLKNFFESKP